jgi:hypothetical protein
MSKAGKKLIEAAKEAVEVAKCEHSLVAHLWLTDSAPKLDRYFCTKCSATIWVPVESWKR